MDRWSTGASTMGPIAAPTIIAITTVFATIIPKSPSARLATYYTRQRLHTGARYVEIRMKGIRWYHGLCDAPVSSAL